MSEDFYEVLGVDRDASEDEINRAFRRKAAKVHPDVSDEPDAEDQFKRLQKAKEVLSDEDKRAAYDRLGHDRFTQAEKQGGVGNGATQHSRGDPFGGMGDIFEQFFGGGTQRRNGPRQGKDLRTDLTIDLTAAYEGVTKEVTLRRPTTCDSCDGAGHPPDADVRRCPDCNGQGQVTQVQNTPFGRVQQTQPCPRCRGDGELVDKRCSRCRGDGIVREKSTLSVDIPAGIRDGQTLRMEGEGAPGERGGRPGDLLIDISVSDHPDFNRDGDDLHLRQPVSFPQAVFGDTITIDTLGGEAELEIPAGSQSGEIFTLEGEGMPRLRRRGYGDLHVQLQIVTPQRLSKEEREALEDFAEAGGIEIDMEKGLFERIRNSF